jgi:ABC-type phosphate transport system substrate-binding protein
MRWWWWLRIHARRPIAAFGLSIGYNLPGAAVNLSLSLPVLAGIYVGNITSWRDESIIKYDL